MNGLLVVLSGLPGTGKTTLARAAAHRLDALYLRIDSIEVALQTCHLGLTELADAGYAAAMAVARDNLRPGRIVIADSVNPIPLTRDAWAVTARAAGADRLEVEVTCSDAVLHRHRIESRRPDLPGQRLPTWADVTARDYHPHPAPDLSLDTAILGPDAACDALVASIKTRLAAAFTGG